METIQLNLPIYKFQCDENILVDIEQKFSSLSWSKDEHNFNTDQFYQSELFSWLGSCLREVQSKHMNLDFQLDIVSCWINKNNKLMRSPRHNHINSVLSGVLYFSNESTSPLVFSFPDPYVHMQNQGCLFLTNNDPVLKTKIYPERGMCIIFPSSIQHETIPHKELQPRYSLAFNTFPNGLLTDNPTMRLDLQPKFKS